MIALVFLFLCIVSVFSSSIGLITSVGHFIISDTQKKKKNWLRMAREQFTILWLSASVIVLWAEGYLS